MPHIQTQAPKSMLSGAMTPYNLLRFALVLFGAVFLLVYPLSILWPSG